MMHREPLEPFTSIVSGGESSVEIMDMLANTLLGFNLTECIALYFS